jgi:NAD(P)-dependent dehydrogenase (short-subunit alcohol dehydrogenase family)
MARLSNKRAIITGAASGIGRASAILFAREGAKVLIADRAEAGLEETRALIAAEGGNVLAQRADAGSEADVLSLVERAVTEFGGLDVIYANAGVSGAPYTFEETSVETFLEVLRINLIGPFLMIKHGGAQMKKQGQGGSIVCTASVAGIRSGAGPIAYSASKAGVINLVSVAANTLRGTGIRVNAVCPGLIETGMTKPLFDYAKQRGTSDRIGQLNPTSRAGQPPEIAAAALFLASDEASYVNGQALAVDGGLSSSLPVVPPRPAARG